MFPEDDYKFLPHDVSKLMARSVSLIGFRPDGYDQRLNNRGMQASIPGHKQTLPREEGKRISFFMFPSPMKRGCAMMHFYVRQHSTLSVRPVTSSGYLLHLRRLLHGNFNTCYPSFN